MAKYLYVSIANSLAKIVNQPFAIRVLPMTKIHAQGVENEILTQNKTFPF
ncbi:MAG: hypothetical protein WC141_06590 [Arcobacteraceae bacterium]